MSFDISEIASGGTAAKFEEVGDKVSGHIKLVERRQQTSFENNTPLTWDDGSPRMLTYVELDTDLRDDDDDDGVRAIYCKGGNFEATEGSGLSAERALLEAAKKAGAKTLDEGAKLDVVFSGRGKATTRGYQPPKLFTMRYAAPKASVDVADLFPDD